MFRFYEPDQTELACGTVSAQDTPKSRQSNQS